jgi:hypothetical protein
MIESKETRDRRRVKSRTSEQATADLEAKRQMYDRDTHTSSVKAAIFLLPSLNDKPSRMPLVDDPEAPDLLFKPTVGQSQNSPHSTTDLPTLCQ